MAIRTEICRWSMFDRPDLRNFSRPPRQEQGGRQREQPCPPRGGTGRGRRHGPKEGQDRQQRSLRPMTPATSDEEPLTLWPEK